MNGCAQTHVNPEMTDIATEFADHDCTCDFAACFQESVLHESCQDLLHTDMISRTRIKLLERSFVMCELSHVNWSEVGGADAV